MGRNQRVHHNRYRLAAVPRYFGTGLASGPVGLADDFGQRYQYQGEDGRPDPMLAAARLRGVIHLRQLTAARQVAAADQHEER